jgi:hypothetical protein
MDNLARENSTSTAVSGWSWWDFITSLAIMAYYRQVSPLLVFVATR